MSAKSFGLSATIPSNKSTCRSGVNMWNIEVGNLGVTMLTTKPATLVRVMYSTIPSGKRVVCERRQPIAANNASASAVVVGAYPICSLNSFIATTRW